MRLRREAKACGKLSHPNITHIYSISGKAERIHYFAMEYVEGRNLAEWVKEEGPFDDNLETDYETLADRLEVQGETITLANTATRA